MIMVSPRWSVLLLLGVLAAPSFATPPLTYRVKAGDTLGLIAQRNGLTANQLLLVNPQLKNQSSLRVGQVLVLTPTQPIAKTVQPKPRRLFAFVVPPDRGLPSNREGGAARGGCGPAAQGLTALVPATNYGLTKAERPRFFWYTPTMANSVTLEFRLTAMDSQRQEQQVVHQATFVANGQGGTSVFELPTSVAPLEIGQDYRWSVAIRCDPEDPSANVFVDGWVRRVPVDTTFNQELKQADRADYPSLYAERGLWYDTLGALVDVKNNPKSQEEWSQLLKTGNLAPFQPEPLLCAGTTLAVCR